LIPSKKIRRTMQPHIRSFLHLAARGTIVLFLLSLILPGSFGKMDSVNAAAGCGSGQRCVYLPILTRALNPPTGDLYITGVEVTQGVQNSANSVPLVAGRSTMLRIYARGQDALPAGSSSVTVSISARQPGAVLSSAPLMLSADLPVTPSRSVYSSTINVPLPAAWLTGNYDLSITLDPQNQIAESNENNNTFVQRLVFTTVPTLHIKIVPIRYTHSPDGRVYPAPTTDSISSWIIRLFPLSNVEVSWHAPFAYSGNMKEIASFSDLLSQVNRLKRDEGAPANQVYYALVPTTDGSSSWFSGGVVGIGYINHRVALGLDYNNAGLTAAHELGHNLGRYHAPCGNPSSPDASYPYAAASIGEYGLDLTSGALYSPDSSRDLMSYCSPKWISDYTYRALFDAQLLTGSAALSMTAVEVQPAPVLHVRAVMTPAGTRLLPGYTSYATPDLPAFNSAYRVQLMGADGQVLTDLPVQALEVAREDDEPQFEIQASLLLPDAAVHAVRVVKADQLLAETSLRVSSTGDELMAISAAQGTSVAISSQVLRWSQIDRPALVRYSLDGGLSWTILAMDVTGGQLDLAAAGLPENAVFEVIPAISN
jgi:hypothetical protein